jgi:hypothetical protein
MHEVLIILHSSDFLFLQGTYDLAFTKIENEDDVICPCPVDSGNKKKYCHKQAKSSKLTWLFKLSSVSEYGGKWKITSGYPKSGFSDRIMRV